MAAQADLLLATNFKVTEGTFREFATRRVVMAEETRGRRTVAPELAPSRLTGSAIATNVPVTKRSEWSPGVSGNILIVRRRARSVTVV